MYCCASGLLIHKDAANKHLTGFLLSKVEITLEGSIISVDGQLPCVKTIDFSNCLAVS